jgi:uncharacterized membrane protein YcaP (DUF421 family)
MSFLWESPLILLASMGMLRLAGKKSISQLTSLELVTILSVGSIVGHFAKEESVWETMAIIAIFVTVLIIMQFIQLKFNFIEKWFIGQATTVIENGSILPENLKKTRMTVDQLEMRLRENGINSVSKVKTATLETNGQLGFELMPSARPVTIGDLEKLMNLKFPDSGPSNHNLFEEVVTGEHKAPIKDSLR